MQYVGTGRLGTTQTVAYTGTAGTITNGFGSGVQRIRIVSTTDCFVTTDGSTATAAGAYLPALSAEYFTVSSGQKASAIQVSAAGSIYVTEIS